MRKLTKLARIVSLLIIVLAAWSLTPETIRAQTLQEEELEQKGLAEQPATGNWNLTLGAGLGVRPTYPGASAYRVQPIPLGSITYRDLLFLSPLGLGMNAINWNGFRAGPVIGFQGGRNQSDNPRLNRLGDIQPSATFGIFAAYRFSSFEVSGTARQAINHKSNGLTGLVHMDYRATMIPHTLDFIAGPELEFADSQFNRTWFGVTPVQSAQSGLPVFTPGACVKDVGLHAILTYHYSEHILLRTFANVKELTGDIASSPIVQRKTQTLVGTGVAYHF
jgi:outer membrane protein